MMHSAALITGCSRGLGLEMVRQLVCSRRTKIRPSVILATCRCPDGASELRAITKKSNAQLHVKILKLDVTDYDSLDQFVKDVDPLVGEKGLGLLVNNAGVSPGLTRLSTVKPNQMLDTFNVNVVAPLMVTKALLPLLNRAVEWRKTVKGKDGEVKKPLVVNMSSILGSIENNTGIGGGIYPYRTSKAALNMLTRSLSLDLAARDIRAIAIHPGWAKTDLGGKNAPLSPGESVAGVLNVLQHFTKEMNGEFYDFEGRKVLW